MPPAERWTLALLATAQLIISLDINIVFVALPEIGNSLGFGDQTLQWVVSAYVVFMGGFMLLGGRAADVLGQRRVFIAALWVYAGSSLLGIVISGVGQGIVWTAMWVAVGTGVTDQEQGIASGIASTAQNTGNAIGLAICVAISSAVIAGSSGAEAVAQGSQLDL